MEARNAATTNIAICNRPVSNYDGHLNQFHRIYELMPPVQSSKKIKLSLVNKTCSETLDRLLNEVLWPKQLNLKKVEQKSFAANKNTGHSNRLLAELDQNALVLWYCERPFAIKYCQNDDIFTYVPDLLIALADGRFVLVDMTATADDSLEKYLALAQYCREAGWGMLILDDNIDFSPHHVSDEVHKPLEEEESEEIKIIVDLAACLAERGRNKRRGSLRVAV